MSDELLVFKAIAGVIGILIGGYFLSRRWFRPPVWLDDLVKQFAAMFIVTVCAVMVLHAIYQFHEH